MREAKIIDYENWSRKEIYEFFSHVSDPFYMVSFTADVKNLYNYAHRHHLSFYMCLIHVITRAINSIESFRYTLREGKVFLLDERHPSFTDRRSDEEFFHITTVKMNEDMNEFAKRAKEQSLAQTCFIEYGEESDDLVYISCLPELPMTALTNERDRLSKESANSNIPSLAWGRFEEKGEKLELVISIEVNHRFVDGKHISDLYKEVQRIIDSL